MRWRGDWQLMFISVPIIFLLEMLFATELAELRSLTRRRHYARPVARFFFLSLYQQPPDLYLGGCEFLSPDHHATGESAAPPIR